MTNVETDEAGRRPPSLRRDTQGRVEPQSLAALIQWFLNYDERVAVVRYPPVETLFQWKQQATAGASGGDDACVFARAEDRLAVGIMQALVEHASERALHVWIKELLVALDESAKTNEEIAEAYQLDTSAEASLLDEAAKLPSKQERDIYLNCCWLETLCTAEARVLGWAYRELYGRPFHPDNF